MKTSKHKGKKIVLIQTCGTDLIKIKPNIITTLKISQRMEINCLMRYLIWSRDNKTLMLTPDSQRNLRPPRNRLPPTWWKSKFKIWNGKSNSSNMKTKNWAKHKRTKVQSSKKPNSPFPSLWTKYLPWRGKSFRTVRISRRLWNSWWI